jgi:hypothetical protein
MFVGEISLVIKITKIEGAPSTKLNTRRKMENKKFNMQG